MGRVILLLATMLVVADATGLLAEADDVCCADEDGGKQCPPSCPTCACPWHTTKTAPAPQILSKTVELVARTVELPTPADAHGQLAPQPSTRPPIV
jgi:hypothetical protein